MKLRILFFLILLCSSLQALSNANDIETIPIIALDAQGNSEIVEVPKENFVSILSHSTSTINDSLIDAFNGTSASQPTSWHLRTVIVGLGSIMEFGLGKFKIGAAPKVRLFFTNSTTPSLF